MYERPRPRLYIVLARFEREGMFTTCSERRQVQVVEVFNVERDIAAFLAPKIA